MLTVLKQPESKGLHQEQNGTDLLFGLHPRLSGPVAFVFLRLDADFTSWTAGHR